MSALSRSYENFQESRNQDCNIVWTSRQLNPQLAYNQDYNPRPTPSSHKQNVLDSARIQELLEKISKKENVSKQELEKKVKEILDEIGYNKNLKLIRWLGLFLVKICQKVTTGIYANTGNLLQLKLEMGNCPVIFVPSHRSYADFILMSYICFTYDIEIPAIAAGMDFHGMWGMGNMLRDTGAFFMRRSYNDDGLYWATFKQYIYQLVTNGDLPIEFFIEGTRSRSNKSLVPKYGLISMILKAFFFSEVPDIKFVPINISYDRILEETLFSYELLGVPKPKESTSGFFKSLKILKENFGKIYFHFGEPISAKLFFGDKLDRSAHNMGPLHTQEITEKEKALIPSLAHEIVRIQQKCGVITIFNLVSLALNNNLVTSKQLLTINELTAEVMWLKDVMQGFGVFVYTEDIEKSIEECFTVHKNLIQLRSDNRICLVQNNIVLDKVNSSKLKAHSLSEKCMTFSVPFVMLQMYINPSLHYFIDVALIVTILKYHENLDAEKLFNTFHFLRSLFSMEFVTMLPWVKTVGLFLLFISCSLYAPFLTSYIFLTFWNVQMLHTLAIVLMINNLYIAQKLSLSLSMELFKHLSKEFESGLQYSTVLNLIKQSSTNTYELGGNHRLQNFLEVLIKPFITSYFVVVVVLEKSPLLVDERTVLINTQKILENKMNDDTEFTHPYCLNLDTLVTCLNVLVQLGALNKTRNSGMVRYEIRRDEVASIKAKLGNYMLGCYFEDGYIKPLYLPNKL